MDRELDEFKSRIDLREYAASLGYELDRRESSRSSSIMRQGGDKVVIKRNPNGHYVYFSVHDDGDNGSIVDFTQKRKGLNLGQVRKELRPWVGRTAAPLPLFSKLDASPKDRVRIERDYAGMKIAGRHPYLEEARKIPAALLGAARFVGRVRSDARVNAIFPHYDEGGLCGYELKNTDFTGFASGGEKGLWESHDQADDTVIVFTESAIDALSHAALFPAPLARYRSIGGAVNPRQLELIKSAIAEMPPGAAVICATDNDDAGRKLAAMVKDCFKAVDRADLQFTIDLPENENEDWNQVLQNTDTGECALLSSNTNQAPLPIARPAPQ